MSGKQKTGHTEANWLSRWERRGEAERIIRFLTGKPQYFNTIQPGDTEAIVTAFLTFYNTYDDNGYRDPWWPKRSELNEWLTIIASPEINIHWNQLTDQQKSYLTITAATS